jgi:hypothetical protein
VTRGVGRDANPIDGDLIVIEVEIRDGKVVTVGPPGRLVGRMDVYQWEVGNPRMVELRAGIEARELGGDTFGECETARQAARVLGPLVIRRTVEEALAIRVEDLFRAMDFVPVENERCVLTVLGALRSALIDVHIAELAEATTDAKRLRVK